MKNFFWRKTLVSTFLKGTMSTWKLPPTVVNTNSYPVKLLDFSDIVGETLKQKHKVTNKGENVRLVSDFSTTFYNHRK